MNRRRLGPEANERLMSAVNILVGLVLALLVFLAVYVRRKIEAAVSLSGITEDVSQLRGITSRSKAACLECGKTLTASAERVTGRCREFDGRQTPWPEVVMSFTIGTVRMESMKVDKTAKTDTAPSTSTLSVTERRFVWLHKQHPKMSRDACRRWGFGR
jgi:hypothetical protein